MYYYHKLHTRGSRRVSHLLHDFSELHITKKSDMW